MIPRVSARRARTVAACALVLVAYTLPLGNLEHFWNPNETSRLMLTVSMVEYGTIRLDPVLDDYGVVPEDIAIRDDHAYSDKAPGLSLLAAPLLVPLDLALPRFAGGFAPDYWPLRHILTWLLICVPAAVFPFVALSGRRLDPADDSVPAYAYALLFALATPVLTYASLFFSHIPAGLMAAGSCLLAQRLPTSGGRAAAGMAFAAGVLAAFAVVTEYPAVILGVVAFLTLVVERGRRPAIPAFLIGGIVGAVPLLLYNQAAWGSVLTTGYAFKASAAHAAVHAQGFFGVGVPTWEAFWGVLFSARRGLLFYCPLLLAIPVGWYRLWRLHRNDTILSMLAVLAYLGFAAGFADWEAGWSAASRHLVAVLPLLLVPLAAGVGFLSQRPRSAALLAVLIGWSASAAVLSVAVTPYFPEMFVNPLADVALRSLGDGAAMQNLVSDFWPIAPIHVFLVYATAVALAVGVALFALVRGLGHRRLVVALFLGTLALHPTVLWISAPQFTSESERARAELLRRIGYGDLAERIEREVAGQR